MNFHVIWLPIAQNQLADAWVNAADRNAVAVASNRIDQRLADDPLHEGESREGMDRIAFEQPLRVMYRVDETARVVHVVSVGTFGRRS